MLLWLNFYVNTILTFSLDSIYRVYNYVRAFIAFISRIHTENFILLRWYNSHLESLTSFFSQFFHQKKKFFFVTFPVVDPPQLILASIFTSNKNFIFFNVQKKVTATGLKCFQYKCANIYTTPSNVLMLNSHAKVAQNHFYGQFHIKKIIFLKKTSFNMKHETATKILLAFLCSFIPFSR